MCRCERTISVHITHVNSLKSIMYVTTGTVIHTIHITGKCPEQICLPHKICISHCTLNTVYIKSSYYFIHKVKQNNKLQLYFQCYNHISASNIYYPSNATHMPIISCSHIRQLDQCVYIYICIYENIYNEKCDQKHWALFYMYSTLWHIPLNKYACHITDICSSALLFSLHIEPTLLHTSIKYQ